MHFDRQGNSERKYPHLIMLRELVTGLSLVLFCTSSIGQTLFNADSVTYQPTVARDEKGVKSCGIRLVVATIAPENRSIAYDFSINLWNSAIGLMKAGSHTMTFREGRGWDYKNMVVRKPGPVAFWLGKRDENLALHPAKYIKAEDAGYVLGGIDPVETTKMMYAILENEPMQISLRYAGDKLDRVVAFNNNIGKDDGAAISGCLKSLIERMDKEGMPD